MLRRDGFACRVCGHRRQVLPHHRVPGVSKLELMITLCSGCHAKVHRTRAVLTVLPPLLLELWREQHPGGLEQTAIDFTPAQPAPAGSFDLFSV